MSASAKKKLRKEQNVAAMTEKQQREKKEAKKLKAYTFTFIVVMALVLVMALGLVLQVPLAGMFDRSSTAVSIGSHNLSTTDLSYYYIDGILSNFNQAYEAYGNYAQYFIGYDMNKSLDSQIYDSEKGTTWADYFVELGIDNAKSTLALYDEAVKNNHKLTEEEQEDLDYTVDLVGLIASANKFSSADAFLRACYGSGANMDTYESYCEIKSLAASYYTAHADSIEYTDEDYRKYEKDKYNTFSSFTYATYTVKVSDYLTGEKDSSGNYTAAQKAAALEAAKKDAEALSGKVYKDFQEFSTASKNLTINKDKTSISFSEYKNALYTSVVNEDVQKWLADSSRKKQDITSIETSSTTTDSDGKETKEVTGYVVVFYLSTNENKMNLVDVQHILVKFTGGTTNATTGVVTYSEAEKKTALNKAYNILEEWKKGEATKESFAALAKEKSDDTGTKENGGLIEDMLPGQTVEKFNDWCFKSTQKPGNTGLVETEYGWHVMYFVEKDERTYRDYMIDNEMLNNAMDEWHENLQKEYAVEQNDMSRLNTGVKVSSLPLLY